MPAASCQKLGNPTLLEPEKKQATTEKLDMDRITKPALLMRHPTAPVYLHTLFDYMSSLGKDPYIACDGMGMAREDFDAPGFRVTHEDACNIVRRALRIVGEPNPGFVLGQRVNLASRGILALGLLTSNTLRDALQLAIRYPQEAGYLIAVGLRDAGSFTCVTLDPMQGNRDILAFLSELTATSIVRNTRILSGVPCTPRAVEFSHPAHAPGMAEYERYFGCPVRFNAAANRILLDEGFLATPVPTSHVASFRLAKDLLDKEKLETSQQRSVSACVAAIVRSNLDQPLTAGQVARALCLSERSLRRKLSQEGHCFQLIVDECRADHVMSALALHDLSVIELSIQTGFTDTRAFRRAFKRWTGCSFTQYKCKFVTAR